MPAQWLTLLVSGKLIIQGRLPRVKREEGLNNRNHGPKSGRAERELAKSTVG